LKRPLWSGFLANPFATSASRQAALSDVEPRGWLRNNDYIRARRYMPDAGKGLTGTELKEEYARTGLLKTGVPYRITVIKKGRELFLHIQGDGREKLCHFQGDALPPIAKGRIGLRHMYTRGARYRDFRVSVPAQP
jgi:hypothetical protein